MTIEEKRCTGECKEIKPLVEFHADKTGKYGRRSDCAQCVNAKYEKNDPVRRGKIRCNRDGQYIKKSHCLPGCNDACISCDNKQSNNIMAGGEAVTPEEERESILGGVYGSSSAIAVNEGHCKI